MAVQLFIPLCSLLLQISAFSFPCFLSAGYNQLYYLLLKRAWFHQKTRSWKKENRRIGESSSCGSSRPASTGESCSWSHCTGRWRPRARRVLAGEDAEWLCFPQIRDLEAEVFRLLKQNGTQVNNNNNIFEQRTSLGEVPKGDTMENLDIKQTSCPDGLSQGLSSITTKIILNACVLQPCVFVFFLIQRFESWKVS